jgi:hypothetical protein
LAKKERRYCRAAEVDFAMADAKFVAALFFAAADKIVVATVVVVSLKKIP